MAIGSLDAYSVEKADPNSVKADIIALWISQGETQEFYLRQYQWFYLNGPPEGVSLYVLKHQNDGIVGCLALTRRKLIFNHKPINAAVFDDFFVSDKHRTLGPAIKLLNTVLEKEQDNYDILYGTPNPKAIPVFRKIGFKYNFELTRYAKVLRSKPFLKGHPLLKNIVFLSKLIDRSIQSLDWAKSLCKPKLYASKVNSALAFDDIWRMKERTSTINERSNSYLQWRFFDDPQTPHTALVFQNAKKETVGYLFFHKDGTRYCIDDILGIKREVIIPMMQSFFRYARLSNIASISLYLHADERYIKELNKIKLTARDTLTVFYIANKELNFSTSQWYFTDADRR